jgi:hypothetical protein
VPARPFLEPVFQKYGANVDEVSRRFLERVAKNLSGELGSLGGSAHAVIPSY